MSAVNDAQLFRFLTKPCASEQLLRACAAGLGQYRLRTAERVLLEQTLAGCVQALAEVLALASPAAFGRKERVRALVERFARAIDPHDRWEVEVSALLVNLGAVTLPEPTAEKLYAGASLTASEQAMVRRVPAITRLGDDVRSTSGSLLIARGHMVTDQLIERLANLGAGAVREPLLVLDAEPRIESVPGHFTRPG